MIRQQLDFCGIRYTEKAINAIMGEEEQEIGQVMKFLRICVMIIRADMADSLTMAISNKARKLWAVPMKPSIDNDIPF